MTLKETMVEKLWRFNSLVRLVLVSTGLFALCLVRPASAHALEVALARIQDGQVHVIGKGARNASILWQGIQVTTSTRGGAFSFTTSHIPATCVGQLTDGMATLLIAVSGCSASGVYLPPPSLGVVTATGQKTMYAIGDDGFYQKGVPSPSPRFTDNLNGTVTDNLTGLVWLKDTSCLGARPWLGALAAVDALTDGACGLSDFSTAGSWRLPNRNELSSLLDRGAGLPSGHPFIEAADHANYYWSSTTYPFIPSTAWGIRILEDGAVIRADKADAMLVIAVRNGF